MLKQIEGKYEILHKMEEGGMGAIYKVRHRLLEEIHVVKVMRPQHAGDRELEQRFLQEAKTAIQLRHPNVAQIYDFAIDDEGNAFIVMEFIDGVTLEEVVRCPLQPSLAMALEVALQALRALAFLHSRDFVHRDISPDNLMLTRTFDGTPLVKLIDLGIAKRPGGEGLTQTGTFMGKIRYSSPEQFAGPGAVKLDQRSDLYSFGVLFYELLTGRCPIAAGSLSQTIAAHLFQPPIAFTESDPHGNVPEGLRTVVLKTLEKNPDDRIQTAVELAEALARFRQPASGLTVELGELLVAARGWEAEEAAPDPGSTQARLDRQFGVEEFAGTTVTLPAPGSDASSEAATQPIDESDSPLQHPAAPRTEVVQDGEESATAPRQREPTGPIAVAALSISRAIEGGSLDTAVRMIEFARSRYGDHPEFDRLEALLG